MIKINELMSGLTCEAAAHMENIFIAILEELIRADIKHSPMDGYEEGVETLKCEVQELYRETKRREINMLEMEKEAVQVGAMAVKFLRDCIK